MASRRALLSILGAAQLFGSQVAAAPLDSGLDICLPFGIEVGLFIDLFEPPQVTDVVTVSVTSTTSIHAAGTYAVPAGISTGTVTAHGPTELCVTSVKTTTTTYPCSTSTSFPSTWWDPCKGSSTSATCRWTPPATGAHTSASTTVTKRVTSTVTQCATSASTSLTSTATSTSSTSASNTVTDTTTSTTQSATSAPITVTITVTPTTQCASSATATVTDTVTSTVTQSPSSVPVRATTVTDTVTSTVTQSASSAPVRVTTVTDTVTDTVTSTVTQPATSCSATTTPTSTPTLSCDPYGYLIQYAELYRVDLGTGTTTEIASGLGDNSSINAIGYNTLDNYLYGYQSSTGTILQISADGTTTTVKADAPPSGSYIGDIDSNGHYWVGLGAASSWAKIDLAPGSSTYGKTLASGTTTSPGYTVADWVYIPSAGEYLYAIGSNTSPSETALLRFDMSTHKWETVANYGALGVVGVGAVYGMNNGTVYASENGNGQIWQFPVSGGKPFKVSQGPSSGNNDGARCVLNLLA